LISEQKFITPDVIAKTLGESIDVINEIIEELKDKGIIKEKVTKIGPDKQIERSLLKPLSETNIYGKKLATLMIRYSYEWKPGFSDADLSTSRPFCRKMIELSKTRVWSRAQIEAISERLGYSVWDRKGGWYTEPDGTRSPECRHQWVSQIVKKKD